MQKFFINAECNIVKNNSCKKLLLWEIEIRQKQPFGLFRGGITKPCTQLHPPPPSSTQLHPSPPSSFQPPPSSLQDSQQYLNQNIAPNWPISPNLGRKIKTRPFWLKIGTYGILEMLIPNPNLDFLSWANLGQKSQSWHTWYLEMLILIPTFGPKKSNLSSLPENWDTWYLEDADYYSKISFLNFKT